MSLLSHHKKRSHTNKKASHSTCFLSALCSYLVFYFSSFMLLECIEKENTHHPPKKSFVHRAHIYTYTHNEQSESFVIIKRVV